MGMQRWLLSAFAIASCAIAGCSPVQPSGAPDAGSNERLSDSQSTSSHEPLLVLDGDFFIEEMRAVCGANRGSRRLATKPTREQEIATFLYTWRPVRSNERPRQQLIADQDLPVCIDSVCTGRDLELLPAPPAPELSGITRFGALRASFDDASARSPSARS